MNIKPLADRVLVLPAPAEEKVGGIIILAIITNGEFQHLK